ncbi:MAG TPA: PHP-associated domain-containing protein [Patescibacteria group bacterium]|nr:PHP-associated domain-containing protein [Patescibacteria group bacterium]
MANIKIDLHTHSILSPDGGLKERDYVELLEQEKLDCIAVTDHNRIDFALSMQQKLGKQIIVGEEISSSDGEIIGLFLSKPISRDLSAIETVKEIKKQNGLVCIPHPFETARKGINEKVLLKIIEQVDCIEVFNGRSLQSQTRELARQFVKTYTLAPVGSSDSHCRIGIGNTYTIISEIPNRKNLVSLLREGKVNEKAAPKLAYLCPKINRLKKCFKFS